MHACIALLCIAIDWRSCTATDDIQGMQLGDIEELLKKWRGRVVILLNPAWAEGRDVPSKHAAFVKSFEVVYCFQPVAIQVCISNESSAPLLCCV